MGPLDISGDGLAVCDAIELAVYREILEILSRSKDPRARILAMQVRVEALLSPAFLRTMTRMIPRALAFADDLAASIT